MYCIISAFNNTFDEKGLIYFVPDFLRDKIKPGQIISIPLKNEIKIGVLLNFIDIMDSQIDKLKIKSIIEIKTDFVFLKKYQIELIKFISSYYFTPIHNSARLFFPKNLREKIDKGKITFLNDKTTKIKYNYDNKKILSKLQLKSYNQITFSKNKKILFHGLTGSGKTEIYIKLIKDYLDKGKQSLFLIPEIILSSQIGEKIKRVFGEEVIIITSNTTEATKTKYWLKIHSGEAKIILGTRSALFYPFSNLALIIVDEEHDNSYISDSAPRYNTIELVNKISDLLDIKLILGTGTPSVNTMYEAIRGKYKVVNLFEKYKA